MTVSQILSPELWDQHLKPMSCNGPLLKLAKCPSGRFTLYPHCFRSIIQSIQQVVQQPDMLDLLNKWKDRSIPHGVMADIYDGNVWKSFNGKYFS